MVSEKLVDCDDALIDWERGCDAINMRIGGVYRHTRSTSDLGPGTRKCVSNCVHREDE